jgi:hypothetical protein
VPTVGISYFGVIGGLPPVLCNTVPSSSTAISDGMFSIHADIEQLPVVRRTVRYS